MEFHQPDIPEIARRTVNGDARIVRSLEELKAMHHDSTRGMFEGAFRDFTESPGIIAAISAHHISTKVRQAMGINQREMPRPELPAVLMAPGYFGPNHYLRYLTLSLGWPPIWLSEFDNLRLRGHIGTSAEKYAEVLRQREAPTIIMAHSRGGPTVLKTLEILQKEGNDATVIAVILISPISYGIREEIAQIARFIPMNTIQEMCPGNALQTNFEHLTPTNRAKVVVINSAHGDQFTSAKNGFVEGGTLILTHKTDGHIQQCVDPNCTTFKIATGISEGIIQAIHQNT